LVDQLHEVADHDDARLRDRRAEPGVNEAAQDHPVGQAGQVGTGLAPLLADADHLADAEATPHELSQVHSADHQVAAAGAVREVEAVLRGQPREHVHLDQGQVATGFAAVVAVAPEPEPGVGRNLLDGDGRPSMLGHQVDALDSSH
jgi:hypothetical protein